MHSCSFAVIVSIHVPAATLKLSRSSARHLQAVLSRFYPSSAASRVSPARFVAISPRRIAFGRRLRPMRATLPAHISLRWRHVVSMLSSRPCRSPPGLLLVCTTSGGRSILPFLRRLPMTRVSGYPARLLIINSACAAIRRRSCSRVLLPFCQQPNVNVHHYIRV